MIEDTRELIVQVLQVGFRIGLAVLVTVTQKLVCNTIKPYYQDRTHGIVLTQDELPPSQLTIDVAKTGRVSLSNITLTDQMLAAKIRERKAKFGPDFPCMIRADQKAPHRHIARVMNICAAQGVWKLSFVAIKEAKGSMAARKKK